MVGDLQTAALVGADGSVDWLCFPRFDSPACFAALLGEEANGRWRIAPTSGGRCTRRRYVENTLVLETEWETPSGTVRVVDCMPPRGMAPDLVRVVEGVEGRVEVTSELAIRFDYGHVQPWIIVEGREVLAVAGPDALWLRASAPHEETEGKVVSRFTVSEGERVPFVLTWTPSYGKRPLAIDGLQAVLRYEAFLERLGLRHRLRRPLARGRASLAGDAQRADVRTEWRHRRRGHDLAPRDPRRLQELGLSLLLAARHHLHPGRAARGWPAGGGPILAAVDAQGRGRRPFGRPDHVRHRRHPTSARVRASLALRLRGRVACARRQRRRRTGPARRAGRGARGGARGPCRGDHAQREGLGASAMDRGSPRRSLEAAGQRHLGVPRR